MNKAELIKALAEMLAEKMEIGEEPTNGEVIETIFPNCIDYKGAVEVKTTLDHGKLFRRSWWDAPYKAESEGKE